MFGKCEYDRGDRSPFKYSRYGDHIPFEKTASDRSWPTVLGGFRLPGGLIHFGGYRLGDTIFRLNGDYSESHRNYPEGTLVRLIATRKGEGSVAYRSTPGYSGIDHEAMVCSINAVKPDWVKVLRGDLEFVTAVPNRPLKERLLDIFRGLRGQ